MTGHAYGHTGSARPLLDRACRSCGCTEENACVVPEHGPCSWADWDLCSRCDGEARAVRQASDLLLLGLLVLILVIVALGVRRLF